MAKKIIRLKVKELMKAQIDHDIPTDAALAKIIGVSVTQVWRAKLPPSDRRHNSPGIHFIAGVMSAFEGPFERFFYLEEDSLQTAMGAR
ncbi:hypothetical protein [Alicyclobacillus sp. ALC3]|uniref:hypothetical protein n=1 Tax=Alicyclobacillus sp. ALC3 TaxID=2796143 RepID=UPI002379A6D9|nr:hypothetical protein [Alicyclobacillus sp. ALC3]WDL96899.1 hypothetical protein JC200_21910 [Alicyclobacillus sp. ALC3]